MYCHLDETIGAKENNINYFFALLGPRFDVMVALMAESLEKKFGQPYKPIYVYAVHPNSHFVKDNFIVLNDRAESLERTSKMPVIYLGPGTYEELNLEFAASERIKEIANLLLTKQETIYIYSFTTAFLELADSKWTVIGPDSGLAKYFDNKINQYEIFGELDLPHARTRIFSSREALYEALPALLPSYITAAYSSGGEESSLISTREELDKFVSGTNLVTGLRNVNANGGFLALDIFRDMRLAPNVNAIVTGRNETSVLVISDQILRGTVYLGNIYPSKINSQQEKQILAVTTKLGNYLSQRGYRGLFGSDFLINNQGEMIIIDLNPRRQGGYACNALALKAMGVELTDLELDCALFEQGSSVELNYEKLRYPRAWAHSKIKPYESGSYITAELLSGDMLSIFQGHTESTYMALFYEKQSNFVDGYVGYAVTTGDDRQAVSERISNLSKELLQQGLSTFGQEQPEETSKNNIRTVST